VGGFLVVGMMSFVRDRLGGGEATDHKDAEN
jgi:hypothetical protein